MNLLPANFIMRMCKKIFGPASNSIKLRKFRKFVANWFSSFLHFALIPFIVFSTIP